MKFLYDTTAPGALLAYPRDDDGPVAGLDPRYVELTLVMEEQPGFDSSTHRLEVTEVIDVEAGTVTRGWQLVELPPPPPPEPDYVAFYSSLLSSQVYQSVLNQAMTAATPAAATTIAIFVSAIGEAMAGRANPQALQQAVFLLLSTVTSSEDDLAELQGLLETHHLAGTYTLAPAPAELVRARDAEGQFIPDDPATPENEAWVTP